LWPCVGPFGWCVMMPSSKAYLARFGDTNRFMVRHFCIIFLIFFFTFYVSWGLL
jgi:hypothetical protein